MSKYHKVIPRDEQGLSDVYDVLTAFGVTCPAQAHAVKKALMPGLRGSKSVDQDFMEAIQSLERARELHQKREGTL